MADPRGRSRLLQLPPEIRNTIYGDSLTADHTPYVSLLTGSPHLRSRMEMQVQLLRTSKQIHAEARAVMLRSNAFVKISYSANNEVEDYMAALHVVDIPVIAIEARGFEKRTSTSLPTEVALMTTTVVTENNISCGLTSVLISLRDNDAAVQLLADYYYRAEGLSKNPSVDIKIGSAAYRQQTQLSRYRRFDSLSARLLAPYAAHFRGLRGSLHEDTGITDTKSYIRAIRRPYSKQQLEVMSVRSGLYKYRNISTQSGDDRLETSCWQITRLAESWRNDIPYQFSDEINIAANERYVGKADSFDLGSSTSRLIPRYVATTCKSSRLLPP